MTGQTIASPPLRRTAPVWQNPRLRGRIPELDGLRGLAIVLVVTFHYLGPWEHIFDTVQVTQLFWSGVDLFFVLSGFLIPGILLDSVDSPTYFKTFYMRRAHRILPIYLISIGCLLAGLAFNLNKKLGTQQIFQAPVPLWVYPLFLQNNAVLFGWGAVPEWMGVTWSLAIEEQFYLVLPALVRFFKRTLPYIATLVICLSPIARIVFVMVHRTRNGSVPIHWSFWTPFRLDGLAMGVLLAFLSRNPKSWNILARHPRAVRGVLFALFIVFCVLTITGMEDLGACFGLTAITGLYGALLAALLLQPGSLVGGIFRWSSLRYLGKTSYCLYIFHQGIHGVLWPLLWAHIRLPHAMRGLLITAIVFVLCLLVAELSWRIIESPLIRRARERFLYATEAL
jgi:peptidoglycan/LPS O-acetylase OafA/YrhL